MSTPKKKSLLSSIDEGDEYTSLISILQLRNYALVEEEIWGLCKECCVNLQSINESSETFQSICITPHSLMLDGQGNVFFINKTKGNNTKLYTPPEYEEVGCTYKGHIFALSMTLQFGSQYLINDRKSRHTRRLTQLFSKMAEPDYDQRADLTFVLHECSAHLRSHSSLLICQELLKTAREVPSKDLPVQKPIPATKPSISMKPTSSATHKSDAPLKLKNLAAVSKTGPVLSESYSPGSHSSSIAPLNNAETAAAAVADSIQRGMAAGGKLTEAQKDLVQLAENQFIQNNTNSGADTMNPAAPESPLQTQAAASAFSKTADSPKRLTTSGAAGPSHTQLPSAFTSSATHFTPIVLTSDQKAMKAKEKQEITSKRLRELKKNLLKSRQSSVTQAVEEDAVGKETNSTMEPNKTGNDNVKPLSNLTISQTSTQPHAASNNKTEQSSIKELDGAAADLNQVLPSGGDTLPTKQPESNSSIAETVPKTIITASDNGTNNANLPSNANGGNLSKGLPDKDVEATIPSVQPYQLQPGTGHHYMQPYSGVPLMMQPNPAVVPTNSMVQSNAIMQPAPVPAPMQYIPFMPAGVPSTQSYQGIFIPSLPTSFMGGNQYFVPTTTDIYSNRSPRTNDRDGENEADVSPRYHSRQRSSSTDRLEHSPVNDIKSSKHDHKHRQKRARSLGREKSSEGMKMSVASNNSEPKPPERKSLVDRDSARNAKATSHNENSKQEKLSNTHKSILKNNSKKTFQVAKSQSLDESASSIQSTPKKSKFSQRLSDMSDAEESQRIADHQPAASPSISKDSGITGISAMPYPSLMDKFLSHVNPRNNEVLGKIIRLIHDEFAYEGYLENGVEDLAMADYINSLKNLKWATFGSAVKEKYCDLYWQDEVLAKLYEAVNGKPPDYSSEEPKEIVQGDGTSAETTQTQAGFTRSPFRPIQKASLPLSLPPKSQIVRPLAMKRSAMSEHSGSVDEEFERRSSHHANSLPRSIRKSKSTSYQDLSGDLYHTSRMVKSASHDALDVLGSKLQRTPSLSLSVHTINMTGLHTIHIEGKKDDATLGLQSPHWKSTDALSVLHSKQSQAVEQESYPTGRYQKKDQQSVASLDLASAKHSKGTPIGGSYLDTQTDFGGSAMSEGSMKLASAKKSTVLFYSGLWQTVDEGISEIATRLAGKTKEELKKKSKDFEQQLFVHLKSRKKQVKFCRHLQFKIKKGLASTAVKQQFGKATAELKDMNSRLDFLLAIMKHLEMLITEASCIDRSLLYSFAKAAPGEPLNLTTAPANPLLSFKVNPRTKESHLVAGSPQGFFSYLYVKDAVCDGYILQLLYCYRYFCSPKDLVTFLSNKYSAAIMETKDVGLSMNVRTRTLDIVQMWIEGFYSVDFKHQEHMEAFLSNFIIEEVCPNNESRGDVLLQLLRDYSCGTLSDLEPHEAQYNDDYDIDFTLDKKDQKKWKSVKGAFSLKDEKTQSSFHQMRAGIVSSLSDLQQSAKFTAGQLSMDLAGDFSLADFSAQMITEQLTILDQNHFSRCHPLHFVNSQAQQIACQMDSSKSMVEYGSLWQENLSSKQSLFEHSYTQDAAIQHHIQHSQNISYWVVAELITASSTKKQSALLTKFITIAFMCKEIRNFASCVAIVDGLENVLIQYLPAWKDVSSKVVAALKNIKVFLKSDAMVLTTSPESHQLPTIPCILLFALHVQQLEIGGYKLTNGMFKWTKMQRISSVINQIHVFKQHRYYFTEHSSFQEGLAARIREVTSQDLFRLASQHLAKDSKAGKGFSNVIKKLKGK